MVPYWAPVLLFYFISKYCTSGLVVIAQILVWSNEDLNAVCKVLFLPSKTVESVQV